MKKVFKNRYMIQEGNRKTKGIHLNFISSMGNLAKSSPNLPMNDYPPPPEREKEKKQTPMESISMSNKLI